MASSDMGTGGMAPTRPNSSTAILSLVFGILGLTFLPVVGSVVALVTGRMAKREIGASAGALGGDGMAKAGVILGWIGVGLFALAVCGFCAYMAVVFGILGAAGGLELNSGLLLAALV